MIKSCKSSFYFTVAQIKHLFCLVTHSDSGNEYEGTQLPQYELPVPRRKTHLEVHEPNEQSTRQKPNQKEDYVDSWESLQPKQQGILDENDHFVLGNGKTSGTLEYRNDMLP